MPDTSLLNDIAEAITSLQSVLTFYGLGALCGIEVTAVAHLRLSNLNLHDMVELEEPRHESDPEINGVAIRMTKPGTALA
jgi:hypothetical protein